MAKRSLASAHGLLAVSILPLTLYVGIPLSRPGFILPAAFVLNSALLATISSIAYSIFLLGWKNSAHLIHPVTLLFAFISSFGAGIAADGL